MSILRQSHDLELVERMAEAGWNANPGRPAALTWACRESALMRKEAYELRTSTPFLRQFKKDCEALHAKLAREKAVAETHADAPGNTSLVSGASSEQTSPANEGSSLSPGGGAV